MTPEEMQAAEAELRARPEYDWLFTSGLQWFSTTDVSRGTGLATPTIRKRCEQGEIPGAAWYGADIGWRMPRSGLIEWFYRSLHGGAQETAG